MPGFQQTLIGIGPICDSGCTVTFSADNAIHDADKRAILSGSRNPDESPALWHFNLLPSPSEVPFQTTTCQQASLTAYSTYDLPSVAALVRCLHAAAGFPVKDTWMRAIKAGN